MHVISISYFSTAHKGNMTAVTGLIQDNGNNSSYIVYNCLN